MRDSDSRKGQDKILEETQEKDVTVSRSGILYLFQRGFKDRSW